ncbi:LRR receptor-like serine threonine-protein kinase [Seminavis robusta]|uniref:LRR receptor-like serine threonine-protein kinase n=1 Tax=Seminavis robusta TaxID=568900 RepID=A0A9N8DIY1_9STRA|nr:LRR receptor-like serine threonine-protein kinase [Seminavis robusta]|eukprot:Sro108_g054100.1 LRR receptor-like serine threonine-protein kinase (531) ;mRNA; f:19881-21596
MSLKAAAVGAAFLLLFFFSSCTTVVFAFDPEVDDPDWPGPFAASSNSVVINIRYDNYPDETVWLLEELESNSTSWAVVEECDGCGAGNPRMLESFPISNLTAGRPYRFTLRDEASDGVVEFWVNENNTILLGTPADRPTFATDVFGDSYEIETTTYLYVFADRGITATIPSEIGLLSALTRLILNGLDNDLHGTLPTELGLLTALKTVRIWNANQLSGGIPSEIGELVALTDLTLSQNNLTLAVPTELGQLSSSLYRLDLSFNQLSGELPSELGQLDRMTFLRLHQNQLSGTIPTEWQQGRLFSLWLQGNSRLNGTADSICDLPSLALVRVDCDSVKCTCPQCHCGDDDDDLPQVRLFGVDYNLETTYINRGEESIQGTIGTEIGQLGALTELLVWQNYVTGSLPSELGQLTVLEELWLHDNRLVGPLPTELGLMTNLHEIRLHSNQFSGTIPSELGLLSNQLTYLDLGSNQLSGPLPSSLGYLTALTALELQRNPLLTGTIHPSLCNSTWTLMVDCESVTCSCPQCGCE